MNDDEEHQLLLLTGDFFTRCKFACHDRECRFKVRFAEREGCIIFEFYNILWEYLGEKLEVKKENS